MKKLILLSITHIATLALGFGLGIYMLPILIAPEGPSMQQVKTAAAGAKYTAMFKRELKGSDFFHWGEGKVSISDKNITFMGNLAPGPDYKLYLSPEFVETEDAFLKIKSRSVHIADIKSFKNFVVSVPESVKTEQFTTVVIWCETFKEFITAAKYR